MGMPETRFMREAATSRSRIRSSGDGPSDLIHVPGFVSHVELLSQVPGLAARGVAEPKGIPGEWRLFAVESATP